MAGIVTPGDAGFYERLTAIINRIHAAGSIRQIIVELTPTTMELLGAERVTVYALDERTGELYSLFKEGSDVSEIRLRRGHDSLAGHCAMSGQVINVADAYDAAELRTYHPRLRFNASWDRATGFRTRQVLAVPIAFRGHTLGVLQLVNRRGGGQFTETDEEAAERIAETLGVAFFNQRRMAQAQRPNPFAYLLETGQLTEEQLERAVHDARSNGRPIAEVLIEKVGIPRSRVLESLGRYYNTPVFAFTGVERMPASVRDRLNPDTLLRMGVAPVAVEGDTVRVAMVDPSDLEKVDMVRIMHLAPRFELMVALASDLEAFLRASYGMEVDASPEGAIAEVLTGLEADEEETADGGAEETVDDSDGAVVRMVASILEAGIRQGASDIHVEPNGPGAPLIVRFRVDGVCHEHARVSPSLRKALVSRLKILANLDIAERRKPQDGKIRLRVGERTVELRVATIPTALGDEDVVLRVLAGARSHRLEELGFSPANLERMREVVAKPYGIVLCVGPTGSGKTTTLHAALGEINTPERTIWTAEDPVEITQPGLRQVQVLPKIGFDFGAAMRAFLRADPDVIMIGEMRDMETASTAVEASLTGHLVLSTLHTNSAPETVTRLLDMGIDALNFADSLLAVLAQRLIRTLCPECSEAYEPSREELSGLLEAYGLQAAASDALLDRWDGTLRRPKGCPGCGGTGYRGRLAVHELMVATEPLRALIRKGAGVDAIRERAQQDGMRTLMQDGIAKVLQGRTTMAQVRAVCLR